MAKTQYARMSVYERTEINGRTFFRGLIVTRDGQRIWFMFGRAGAIGVYFWKVSLDGFKSVLSDWMKQALTNDCAESELKKSSYDSMLWRLKMEYGFYHAAAITAASILTGHIPPTPQDVLDKRAKRYAAERRRAERERHKARVWRR